MKIKGNTLLWLGGAAAAIYFLSKQQSAIAAATGLMTPTPLSIYPEYAYTQTTSMASTPKQQATTVIQPTTLYSAAQGQAQAAIETQCIGSYPGCTPLLGDWQLGL